MPTKIARRHYNLVDDSYDTRVPLHNEDAFQHGISFKAKYIGSLDVQRPSARTEIVVAMRNIRYEFKAKQIKKRKVTVSVSIDGVQINLRKKKKRKNQWLPDEKNSLLMHDPVYRIFYVSHDSHDLKIWSYIARDGNSNRFRCNVFKSNRKRQAMHIVRTIGQAFEVCHKFNPQPSASNEKKNETNANDASNLGQQLEETDIDAVGDVEGSSDVPRRGVTDLDSAQKINRAKEERTEPGGRRSLGHVTSNTGFESQLMRQQVVHAEQQAQVASARVKHLEEQLRVEKAARVEIQARNHQLLVQNRELISHMVKLVDNLKAVEQPTGPGAVSLNGNYSSPLIIGAESLLSSQISPHGSSHVASGSMLIENNSLTMTSASPVQQSSRKAPHLMSVVGNEQTKVPIATESSDDSSTSSSSESGESLRVLIKKFDDTTSPFSDTVNTSIWTGLGTPSTPHLRPDDTLLCDVTPLSSPPANDITNGHCIYPVLSSEEATPPSRSVGSPIKWRTISPSLEGARSRVVIPRIEPPPRFDRSNSSSSASRVRRHTPLVSPDPHVVPVSPDEASPFNDPKLPLESSPQLFDFDSSSHERRVRYQPLHEAARSPPLRTNKTQSLLTGKQPCILSTSFNDDIETTLGSILDEAGTTENRFSGDFWEVDFKTAPPDPVPTLFNLGDHVGPTQR